MKPPKFVAVIDTREQNPLRLVYGDGTELPTERAKLYTGDYSIRGLEHKIAIERKSLDDLMGCIGKERDRFEKEIQRLRGYETKALVVESSWMAIERGQYRSAVKPNAAIGSLMGWIDRGIPVVMAGDHMQAGRFVCRLLTITARRRLEELAAITLSGEDL